MEQEAGLKSSLQEQFDTFYLEMAEFVMSGNNKWFLALILGFVLGLLSRRIVLWLERRFHRGPEHRLLSREFQEVVTHYDRNLELLAKIVSDLDQVIRTGSNMAKLPSAMHFEKLKMPEDAAMFNEKTLRLIHGAYVERVLRTRIRVRNRNTEADQLINYMGKGACDPKTLLEYVTYVEKHHRDTRDQAQDAVNELTAWFKPLRRLWARLIRVFKKPQTTPRAPRVVIYEPWSSLVPPSAPPRKPPTATTSGDDPVPPPEDPRLADPALRELEEQEEEKHQHAFEEKKKAGTEEPSEHEPG